MHAVGRVSQNVPFILTSCHIFGTFRRKRH